ncbi:MAG: glycine cleavage system protein H [Deltaproteobacteria bacterium]|nr:glycine cleavage system protein H [Deltaproteobacteria bacterium]
MDSPAGHPMVRNCYVPAGLWYDTTQHLWFRREDNGWWTLGLTDMAQTAAGKVLHCTPRPAGSFRPAGKPVALLEAAKWLGVVRLGFDATVAEVNPEAREQPFLLNQFPYGRGWVMRVNPAPGANPEQHLKNGDQALKEYTARFDEFGLDDCVHCLGFGL